MQRLILLFTLMLAAFTARADKPIAPEAVAGTTQVTAEQLVGMIKSTPELVIIDARHHDEYLRGHIEGALSMLDTEMTAARLAQQVRDKETPLLFYCNGERCLRSANAAHKAVKWGYRRVFWLRGGWQEWTSKALPISQ
ncbi:MAG TPA: rhodanese-like domain-containing protein [Gammaproteobacteria bacterium]